MSFRCEICNEPAEGSPKRVTIYRHVPHAVVDGRVTTRQQIAAELKVCAKCDKEVEVHRLAGVPLPDAVQVAKDKAKKRFKVLSHFPE